MIKIEVKYKPRWWFFHIKRLVLVPEKQAELTQKHFLLISTAADNTDNGFIARYCNLPKRLVKNLPSFFKYHIIETINKISNSKFAGHLYIKRVKCGRQWLYAPGEKLKGVTFGQFIFIDAWFNDTEPESLDKFIAHLYLPKNKAFNESECIARAEKLKLYAQIKEAIALNYSFFYQYFQEAYPLLFVAPSETPDGKKGKYDPRGWLKVYENVRGDDIVNDEKYAATPVNTMFRYLNDKVKEAAMNRKKLKAN